MMHGEPKLSAFLWWQKGIIYQVYPRSFQDTDGDGIGDLRGVMQRLDHLEWLGVDAVWLSPIYPSPMADFGYDVSDYTGIHPLFGTMDDFDTLLEAAHSRGLKLILDLVPNHSSDQHPWFVDSRSSRDNSKRDWYIWADAKPDGSPPNNWLSVFGGGAWEWDEATEQFYYHAFLKEQPDLNWRNPEVQRAMLDVMRFWLDRGVDGFRVDVIWHMIKDAQLRDNPPNPGWTPDQAEYRKLIPAYSTDQPEVHDTVAMMRGVLDEYDERVMIGEIYLPINQLVTYYGKDGSGAHLPFNFQLIDLPWEAEKIFAAISEYEGALPPGGWPNWVLGNHDKPRIASRVGEAQARVAALLLLTLRGTPTLYYGDEIGMHYVAIPPDRVQDPQGLRATLGGADDPLANSRDPARTPMQWDSTEHAGFTTGTPWLPVGDDSETINVRAEQEEPASMLSFQRRLIELRQREPALSVGSYAPAGIAGDAFAFVREHAGERLLVAVNLGHRPVVLELEQVTVAGEVLLGTHAEREGKRLDGPIELHGDEGIVLRLAA